MSFLWKAKLTRPIEREALENLLLNKLFSLHRRIYSETVPVSSSKNALDY